MGLWGRITTRANSVLEDGKGQWERTRALKRVGEEARIGNMWTRAWSEREESL